ncbi:MAG TPA: hypothetical protein VK903_16145 [Propionicimonas sp.]|nr:hypothetical protein [Propionicimonas sp.]
MAVGDLDASEVVEVPAALESVREAKQVRELRARIIEQLRVFSCASSWVQ